LFLSRGLKLLELGGVYYIEYPLTNLIPQDLRSCMSSMVSLAECTVALLCLSSFAVGTIYGIMMHPVPIPTYILPPSKKE
jgi:hypothetical protein